MKRLGALFSVLLFLAACTGGAVTESYALVMETQDPARREALSQAAMRVVERRIQSMQVRLIEQAIRQEEDGSLLMDVTVDDPATIELLSEQLARPLDFAIMIAAEEGEAADITVESFGGFRATGITEEHLAWVEAAAEGGEGIVRITLTEEGRTAYAALLASAGETPIGIVVRGVLVSILQSGGGSGEDIIIRGIPTPAFAEIFADDVIVGTHVTFTPRSSLPLLP